MAAWLVPLTDNGSRHACGAMRDCLRCYGRSPPADQNHHVQASGWIERWYLMLEDEVTLVVRVNATDAHDGRRDAIVAQRRGVRIRAMLARRQHYRQVPATAGIRLSDGGQAAGAGTRRVSVDSDGIPATIR
jgi:hypothetical protein